MRCLFLAIGCDYGVSPVGCHPPYLFWGVGVGLCGKLVLAIAGGFYAFALARFADAGAR